MSKELDKLVTKHQQLNHADMKKVVSHVQREEGDWVLHTLMLEGWDVPFKFKRKKAYRSLVGASVNVTYYAASENIAGIDFEVMKVVRLRQS